MLLETVLQAQSKGVEETVPENRLGQARSLGPCLCGGAGAQPADCSGGPWANPWLFLGEKGESGRDKCRAEASRQNARAGKEQLEGWSGGGLGRIVGVKAQPGRAQWEQLVLPQAPGTGEVGRSGEMMGWYSSSWLCRA